VPLRAGSWGVYLNTLFFQRLITMKSPFSANASIPRQAPKKWPFPPDSSPSPRLTRGAMVADICLVAVWGALIPGIMWLGVASGF
jgi:hypothetical protein